MNPWMQEHQEDSLDLRKHATEGLERFKAAPLKSTGMLLVRTVKLSFVIAAGTALAALKVMSAMSASSSRYEEQKADNGETSMGEWYDVEKGKYVSTPTLSSVYVGD